MLQTYIKGHAANLHITMLHIYIHGHLVRNTAKSFLLSQKFKIRTHWHNEPVVTDR